MERFSIDDAIKQSKIVANRYKWSAENADMGSEDANELNADICNRYVKEYRQIAKWLEEFKSYKQLEEQGLLVRLPVKIGDDIYKIPSKANYDLNVLNGYKANNRVYHQKAYSIVFSQSGWFVQCDKDSIHAPNVICVDVEYGKTWFLTREEAEKKLEEMKNE